MKKTTQFSVVKPTLLVISVLLVFLCGIIQPEYIMAIQIVLLLFAARKVRISQSFIALLLILVLHTGICVLLGRDTIFLAVKQLAGIIVSYLFYKTIVKNKDDALDVLLVYKKFAIIIAVFALIQQVAFYAPVVWTLHDCWAYTGHCPYYDFVHCNKWMTGCYDCPQTAKYPYSDVDRSKEMFEKKKQWFTGANITLVSPSEWLGNEVKKSFLAEYPVRVINNGIDLDTFRPIQSDFRKKYQIENKFIILGVASSWAPRKGLDVFVKLAEDLPEEYQIVIVGIDEREKNKLPETIISITRTNNQKELAEIYSVADVFVNPTREENFPTSLC